MKMYLPPAQPARRIFLKRGLAGSALLAIGGLGFLTTRQSLELKFTGELRCVNASQYALLAALAERFIPKRFGFPSAAELDVAQSCDAIIDQLDPSARDEVLQLLTLFESAIGNFTLGARPKTFTQMPPDEQDRVMEEWRTSRFVLRRSGYTAVRNMVMAAYFGHPKSWEAVGYPGPPPGIHQPDAPVWRGHGAPRPPSAGNWVEASKEGKP